MTSLKNTIEDIVVGEAKSQLAQQGKSAEIETHLNEIVAYALNRLPPLYASTDRGWLQQRKRARTELSPRIVAVVRQSIQTICDTPIRPTMPLPPEELESSAYTLSMLQKILCKPNLRWKDLPDVVEQCLDNVVSRGTLAGSRFGGQYGRQVIEVKSYLQRSKVNTNAGNNSTVGNGNWRDKRFITPEQEKFEEVESEDKDFESYMLATSCITINALEKLVLTIAVREIDRMKTVLSRKVSLEDVAAYVLNRLPPMYATSAEGLDELRHRARAEMSDEIVKTIKQSLQILSKMPRRLVAPLPFTKFDVDREQALAEVAKILQQEDLNWRNVTQYIEDALEEAKRGRVTWRKRSQFSAV